MVSASLHQFLDLTARAPCKADQILVFLHCKATSLQWADLASRSVQHLSLPMGYGGGQGLKKGCPHSWSSHPGLRSCQLTMSLAWLQHLKGLQIGWHGLKKRLNSNCLLAESPLTSWLGLGSLALQGSHCVLGQRWLRWLSLLTGFSCEST